MTLQEENEKLRGLLEAALFYVPNTVLRSDINTALSQQAEPYGFHDSDQAACQQHSGQVPCEPSPAQDECYVKGDASPVGGSDKFEAGIHVDEWFQRIVVYGDSPEDAEQLRDKVLMALTRPAQDTFCAYCGGNDEEPQDHCMDCTRPLAYPGGTKLYASPIAQAAEEFNDSQWWFKELEQAVSNGTPNQRRALEVVRNLLANVNQSV